MSYLVPEVRVDVNGRRVTRHVKPTTGPSLGTPFIPDPNIYSKEFSQSWGAAREVSELLYSFNDDGQMLDAYGDEVHDYGFEEVAPALQEMLPSETLLSLQKHLEGAEGRRKLLLWEQVANNVYDYCLNSQQGIDNEKLGIGPRAVIQGGINLAKLADDFVAPDFDLDDLASAMKHSARMIRRNYSTPKWNEVLNTAEKKQKFLESEFIVYFVTKNRPILNEEPDPEKVFKERMMVMDEYDRIKRHQDEFTRRGNIDVSILDELDQMSWVLRDGTL